MALVDSGYKLGKEKMGVKIKIPGSGKGNTNYQRSKDRARFNRRVSIEPMIGHLKSDYRMIRNYLKCTEGDIINTIRAATAFNIIKKLRRQGESILFVIDQLVWYLLKKYNSCNFLKNSSF